MREYIIRINRWHNIGVFVETSGTIRFVWYADSIQEAIDRCANSPIPVRILTTGEGL